MEKIHIVIFGMGAMSKFLTIHTKEYVEIVAYLVTEPIEEKDGMCIISLEELEDIQYDYIVVAFGNVVKGIEILKKAGIPKEKIVGYAYSGLSYEDSVIQMECNKIIQERLLNEKIPMLFDVPVKQYFLCGMNILENQDVIKRDFVREQTISMLAEEINRRDVKGNVAEIGVSKGEFARIINFLFPDRKLYLFDTFEGLSYRDRKKAIELGWGEKLYAMGEKGVLVEEVLNNMPYRDNCIIKKGYFPDSFDLEDSFAFVSLDIDFYDSTKRGLELIYSYLSKGGYIMVHDFNNLSFTECKKAVMEFCEENNVAYVPIPDVGGTVVITK